MSSLWSVTIGNIFLNNKMGFICWNIKICICQGYDIVSWWGVINKTTVNNVIIGTWMDLFLCALSIYYSELNVQSRTHLRRVSMIFKQNTQKRTNVRWNRVSLNKRKQFYCSKIYFRWWHSITMTYFSAIKFHIKKIKSFNFIPKVRCPTLGASRFWFIAVLDG